MTFQAIDDDGAPDFGIDDPIPYLITTKGWEHVKALAEYGADDEEEVEVTTVRAVRRDREDYPEQWVVPMDPGEPAASWTQIAAELGCTRERARQIGEEAMDKLAHRIRRSFPDLSVGEAIAAFSRMAKGHTSDTLTVPRRPARTNATAAEAAANNLSFGRKP